MNQTDIAKKFKIQKSHAIGAEIAQELPGDAPNKDGVFSNRKDLANNGLSHLDTLMREIEFAHRQAELRASTKSVSNNITEAVTILSEEIGISSISTAEQLALVAYNYGDGHLPTGWQRVANSDAHVNDPMTGVRIDTLQNGSQIVVVVRGTTNVQGWYQDVTIWKNDQIRQVMDTVTTRVKELYEGNSNLNISFIGHSSGGNGAALLANNFIGKFASPSEPQSRTTVTTYNSAGIPDLTQAMIDNIGSITTNYRTRFDDQPPSTSAGYSAGDLASTLYGQPGEVREYAIPRNGMTPFDAHGYAKFIGMNPAQTDLVPGQHPNPLITERMAEQLSILNGYGESTNTTPFEATSRLVTLLGRLLMSTSTDGTIRNEAIMVSRNLANTLSNFSANGSQDSILTSAIAGFLDNISTLAESGAIGQDALYKTGAFINTLGYGAYLASSLGQDVDAVVQQINTLLDRVTGGINSLVIAGMDLTLAFSTNQISLGEILFNQHPHDQQSILDIFAEKLMDGVGTVLGSLINSISTQFTTATQQASPLVLDLDRDGVELSNVSSSSAFFDLDVNGMAERAGWVNSDDGLLAMDRNADGTINNNSELFGNYTAGANGGDGFAALRTLDSNYDGVINASDAQFGDLRIWQDADQDGISDTGELRTLSQLGIASINLNSTAANYDINGNHISATGSFTWANGSTSQIVDAWFAVAA